MKKYTIRDLDRDFPTEESCLDWLRGYLYPDGIDSSKYLQTYLDEYTYRYNHRKDTTQMFVGMLQQVAKG
jgi:hypothetical protein